MNDLDVTTRALREIVVHADDALAGGHRGPWGADYLRQCLSEIRRTAGDALAQVEPSPTPAPPYVPRRLRGALAEACGPRFTPEGEERAGGAP